MKIELLMPKIDGYFKDGELSKDVAVIALAPLYRDKSRHNLETARILWNISVDTEKKEALEISEGYEAYDWVISAGYYAMYHAAYAALSAIGIKASSHETLINGLEYYFVHKGKKLEQEFIKKISKARRIEERYVNRMWAAKTKRNIAHYRAERTVTKKDSNSVLNDTDSFVDRMEQLIEEIKC